ncbi:WD40 repeat-like protein [Eremomyces bilateralis CBS 781.70]|uniref:Mitochondrial division protein 1 n=1 Tax=Eremomyces bilateralis CBS 781.70 TaxID=1392243 RepID=A0A6G1GDU0_9PEZI|nr:WD40 repeat-like protein [Eremomyces bilateralis CBS 781.70]KAF1816218.1 WD40 repeat-like protein [Eremomyces bilateralis CBS 781.70]
MAPRTRRARGARQESPEEVASPEAPPTALETAELPDRTQDGIETVENEKDEGNQKEAGPESSESPTRSDNDQVAGQHRSPSPKPGHSPIYTTHPQSSSPPERSPLRSSPSPSQQLRAQSSSRTPRKSRSRSPVHLEPHAEPQFQSPERPKRLHYRHVADLPPSSHPFSTVKISPSGRLLAAGSSNGSIFIHNASTLALEHVLEGHLAGVSVIAWSSDGNILASGSDDKSIRLWNTVTGKPFRVPLVGHDNYVVSVAWTPKGNILVSGSFDEAVFLWDVRGRRIMKSLPAHSDPVYGVDVARDGTLICSCSSDGLIRIWDTATGQCLRTLVHEDNASVTSARFSPNGKFVLAWTLDSSIRLWDYGERRRCLKTYQGHKNEKFSLTGSFGVYGSRPPDAAKSPAEMNGYSDNEKGQKIDGEGVSRSRYIHPFAFIVSGSEDGSIFFWDVGSKEVLQCLDGHSGPVLGVDAHPTEPMVVSCGMDGRVKIWRDDGASESSNAGSGAENDVHMEDATDGVDQEIKLES